MRIVTPVLAALLCITAPLCAEAQHGRIQIAAKGGVTIENSEDGLAGTVRAGGVSASMPVTKNWRGEIEIWVPSYLADPLGSPNHRDILVGASLVRRFDAGRLRPFALAGLTFARTEDQVLGQWHIGHGMYLTAGGGIDVPLSQNVSLLADVRVSAVPASVLVRPAVGMAFGF